MELAELTERLRDQIVTALHVGRVRGGDRLPGVRDVARDTGANPRTVAKAYRQLEREGLIELRARSGVYVAKLDHWGGRLLEETGRWLGGILLEAWKRNIRIPDLADLIRRCTRGTHLRAACVAENEDDRRAICEELTENFGIRSAAVPIAELPARMERLSGMPPGLREADLVVTTPLHAGPARAAAEALDKPLVMISLHPALVDAIERRLREGLLIVVCADRAFGEQVRVLHGRDRHDRIQVVLASDAEKIAALDPTAPVLLTRAAQERLAGGATLTPLVPFIPFISPDSAREIAELMVRVHMEREHGA
ncbi:MAG: GntR family transcriptional regulator [Gemmatimonadota bacterium]